MNNSGTSGDGKCPSQFLSTPAATSDFLFINQTSNSLLYKAGNCQYIRSHVRKRPEKQFQQKRSKHKELRKREIKQESRPLVPPGPGQSTFESLFHDANCPNARLDRSWLSWLASLDTDTGLGRREGNTGIESSCKACGSQSNLPIRQKPQENKERMRVPRQSRQAGTDALLELSPIEVLGAGRVDPFSSCPVEKPDRALHEALDHQLTYLLPGLHPEELPSRGTNQANSTSLAMMSAALEFPLLFDSMIYSSMFHRSVLYSSKACPNLQQALPYKLRIIQRLKEVISQGSEGSRDEVIFAIMALAWNESVHAIPEKKRPFNTPLRTAKWINVYGNVDAVPTHVKAVLDLIALRGGIENLKLRGLAEMIEGGDVLSALRAVRKPVLPPLHRFKTHIASIKTWATSPPRVQILSSAFWRLRQYGLTDSMLQGLDSMGAVTMAIDDYVQGKPGVPTLGSIVRIKTAVQKRFLFLPTAEELNITPSSKLNLYESCRLTAIIFSVAVFFPLPNTYSVLQTLVQRLKAAIIESGIESHGAEFSGVLLWILVLGGIAALDKPERGWFVSHLALLRKRLKIEWEGAEDILETFLWLEIACSPGGRQLWDEALNLGV